MEQENNSGEVAVEAAAQSTTDESYEQADVQTQEEKVPLSALQAERKQRQELQQNMKLMQEHLEVLRANSAQEKPKQDEFSNLQDDDVLTVGEAKKFLGSMEKNYQMSIEELKMQQTNPDYSETIREYLPDVLAENPDLKSEIQRANNPYKLAYFLAKKSDKYKEEHSKKQKSETAERIIKNSNRPGNLSAVGQNAPANMAKNWASMSDDEFMKHVNKNLGYR